MPAIISYEAKRSITSPRSPDAQIGLITIYPTDGSDPIRITTQPVDLWTLDPLVYGLTSRGLKYRHFVVSLALPDSSREKVPSAAISFDNADYTLVKAARSSITQARMDLEVVLSSDLNFPIKSYPNMKVTEATADIDNVTLTAGYDSFVGEPLHKFRLTRNVAPSLRPNS